MKSGKMIILYSLIVFVIVGVFGFNFVCSISNFKVNYQLASTVALKDATEVQDKLDVYLHENLVFFDEQKLTTIFDDYDYLELVSIKKAYPNQVELVVKEKTEVYAVKTTNGYAMLDVDGRIISFNDVNKNNVDGVENTLIEINPFTIVESDAVIGDAVVFDNLEVNKNISSVDEKYTNCLESLFKFCKILDESFDGIRSNIKSAKIIKAENLDLYFYKFITTEGVAIEIDIPSYIAVDGTKDNDLQYLQTIAPIVNDYYVNLADSDKLFGRIVVEPKINTDGQYNYAREDGENCYTISYTPREPITG